MGTNSETTTIIWTVFRIDQFVWLDVCERLRAQILQHRKGYRTELVLGRQSMILLGINLHRNVGIWCNFRSVWKRTSRKRPNRY